VKKKIILALCASFLLSVSQHQYAANNPMSQTMDEKSVAKMVYNAAILQFVGAVLQPFLLGVTDLTQKYIWLRMLAPKLIRSITPPEKITRTMGDLYFSGETKNSIQEVIEQAKIVIDAKDPNSSGATGRINFQNVLLWGPSGVGKTAVVEAIAKEAGMILYKTSGGDFAKLRDADLQQIELLFDAARAAKGPAIIFIDEMEIAFPSRLRGGASEVSYQRLSKLLTELEHDSNQIMIIGATNMPGDIDYAVYRRFPTHIKVTYPDEEGRRAIINIYVRSLFLRDPHYSVDDRTKILNFFNADLVAHMAKTIGDIAPAEIKSMMEGIKANSLYRSRGIPTKEIVDREVAKTLSKISMQREGFERAHAASGVGGGAVAVPMVIPQETTKPAEKGSSKREMRRKR